MKPEILTATTTLLDAATSDKLFARRRHRLMKELELYHSLPADSRQKEALLRLIDRQTAIHIGFTEYREREPLVVPGLIVGLVLSAGFFGWFIMTQTPFDWLTRFLILWLVCLLALIAGLRRPHTSKR